MAEQIVNLDIVPREAPLHQQPTEELVRRCRKITKPCPKDASVEDRKRYHPYLSDLLAHLDFRGYGDIYQNWLTTGRW